MIQKYKDLQVYEKSYRISLRLYKLAAKFPKEEQYGITSQVKRASTSIPLNIAEGWGKRKNGNEFKRFLMMSIGSCEEVKVLLDYCKDLSFISTEEYSKLTSEYEEIGKMLNSLHTNWK